MDWFARASLADWQRLAQIAFLVFTATLALLTYRSAKRGLLNTVNTEYQKRAMECIQHLSDELLAEFDPRSPSFWYHDWQMNRYVEPVFEAAAAHRQQNLPELDFAYGVPDSQSLSRLRDLLRRVTSEPFLPELPRQVVVAHLQRRHDLLFGVWIEVFNGYIKELASGQHGVSMSNDVMLVGSRLLKAVQDRKASPQEVESEVHEVRLQLQSYLESFNPFPGRRGKHKSRKVLPDRSK